MAERLSFAICDLACVWCFGCIAWHSLLAYGLENDGLLLGIAVHWVSMLGRLSCWSNCLSVCGRLRFCFIDGMRMSFYWAAYVCYNTLLQTFSPFHRVQSLTGN